jgi:hypothetical protein
MLFHELLCSRCHGTMIECQMPWKNDTVCTQCTLHIDPRHDVSLMSKSAEREEPAGSGTGPALCWRVLKSPSFLRPLLPPPSLPCLACRSYPSCYFALRGHLRCTNTSGSIQTSPRIQICRRGTCQHPTRPPWRIRPVARPCWAPNLVRVSGASASGPEQ